MTIESSLFDLGKGSLNAMSRQQLVEAIRERSDCLPEDLLQRGEDETIERLHLVLFSARLIHALRHMPRDQRLGTFVKDSPQFFQ